MQITHTYDTYELKQCTLAVYLPQARERRRAKCELTAKPHTHIYGAPQTRTHSEGVSWVVIIRWAAAAATTRDAPSCRFACGAAQDETRDLCAKQATLW